MQKTEDNLKDEDIDGTRVEYFAASPGHCKTAFNRYKGSKDAADGAEVVVRLVLGEGAKGGFWEFEEGIFREVPW